MRTARSGGGQADPVKDSVVSGDGQVQLSPSPSLFPSPSPSLFALSPFQICNRHTRRCCMMTATRLEQWTASRWTVSHGDGDQARAADGDRTTDECKDGSSRSWSSFQKPELLLFNSFMQAGVVLWLPLLIGLMESGNLIRPSPLID
jgi:hypothetical protein